MIYHNYGNRGIAVASDAGLVVPNVKDADARGCRREPRRWPRWPRRPRDGKLAMDDTHGGSFTVTNGGVFGFAHLHADHQLPKFAILGLHKTQDRPVAIDGASRSAR